MDYKKAFFSKLEDCYLGVKIKSVQNSITQNRKNSTNANGGKANANSTASGAHTNSTAQSGFTNLLHIKAQYFAHIKVHLETRINELVGDDSIESNDIYNKLYTFFDSYLNETGTPFFTDTPIYKNIYAKIYSNSKDTSLFYKTQNLYYVKSDTLYQSLTLQDNEGRFSIFFDASEYRQNADNNKSKVVFKLDSISSNPTHPLTPSAREGGQKGGYLAREGKTQNPSESSTNENQIPQITIKVTNQKDLFPDFLNVFKANSNEFSDDFIKALIDKDLLPKKPTDSHLESLKKLFSSYKKQNEIDFFIHKDAQTFLQEQFDLWMFGYLYKDSAFQQWNNVAISRLQQVKNLAYEIIDFIARFEDELKAIWLKPKFAKNTQYVFSIETILANAYKDFSIKAEDSPTIAEDSTSCSPSLAEGARGWASRSKKLDTLLERIFSDTGFESQIKEWRELKLINKDFDISSLKEMITASLRGSGEATTKQSTLSPSLRVSEANAAIHESKKIDCHDSATFDKVADSRNDRRNDRISPSLAEGDTGGGLNKYKFLPIDTKHLSKETQFALLSAFDDLESLLNGELIKSDNFQALNSIMPKYQNKIDLIYIDPPYNTGNDDFIYADKFNHASWLSMISNRLELSKNILNDKGSIFVSIDDNEQANLKLLMDSVFGDENFVANIIWRKRAGGGNDSKHIAIEQDYILVYSKDIFLLNTNGVSRPSINKYKQDSNGYYTEKPLNDTALQDSAGLHYDIQLPNGKILKGNEHQWKMAESTFLARLERDEIIFKSNDKVYYKHYIDINSNLVPASIWYDLALNADATQDIKHLFGDKNFDTPKPEKLINRIAEIASKKDSIILDFFAGSGTTCAVALKLGRKFIGIEMGEHFYKVVLPRLKKVIAGFASGISKEVEYKGGGAFRYYELESYEEALANCEYVLDSSLRGSVSEENIALQSTLSPSLRVSEANAAIHESKKIDCHDSATLSKVAESRNDRRNDRISPSLAEGDTGGGYIIDYRKSRKLIKELNKKCDKPITLNMSGYRAEFDIFQSIANLMGWKIKRLFLDSTHPLTTSAKGGGTKDKNSANDIESANAESVGIESCEYHNGEILNLESIDIAKYPKLKNLIWWESNA
ncbi:site-specific DNA-methyltransferase [Helicobacter sp. T3_23-1056]